MACKARVVLCHEDVSFALLLAFNDGQSTCAAFEIQ